jgi:hypothetical protein
MNPHSYTFSISIENFSVDVVFIFNRFDCCCTCGRYEVGQSFLILKDHYILGCVFSSFIPTGGGGGSKTVPLAGREDAYGVETCSLPYFLDNRLTGGSEIVSLTRQPPFTPQEDS